VNYKANAVVHEGIRRIGLMAALMSNYPQARLRKITACKKKKVRLKDTHEEISLKEPIGNPRKRGSIGREKGDEGDGIEEDGDDNEVGNQVAGRPYQGSLEAVLRYRFLEVGEFERRFSSGYP